MKNKLIKHVLLHNTSDGHSKMWIGELYDDGLFIARWGKIGAELQSKEFPDAGEAFLLKKYNENAFAYTTIFFY